MDRLIGFYGYSGTEGDYVWDAIDTRRILDDVARLLQ
jgi:hypothetical protein